MSKKFDRVLSSDEVFDLHEKYDGCVFKVIESVEQVVLAKLAGQEPVAKVSKETFSSDGTSDIITNNLPIGTPLYTHPFATPMNSKTFCVSENEKCDTQTGGQVKNEKHKGN